MPLLVAEKLSKEFPVPKPGAWFAQERLRAVDEVSLELELGKVLGIVGESGSGKSTLGRMLMALEEPSAGRVFFDGQEISAMSEGALKPLRRNFQMVFQDPMAAMNPRHRLGEIVGEPLRIHERLSDEDAFEAGAKLLEEVGLNAAMAGRFPHELSGGQRQRVMIARAISCRPKLLVADEPVSSLDVTIQAQILELLQRLQKTHQMAMVFISHDLRIVERLSDSLAVMKDGKVIEYGRAREIYRRPQHAYTKELLEAGMTLPAMLMTQWRERGKA